MLRLMKLENRIVLDAAAVDAVADHAADLDDVGHSPDAESAHIEHEPDHDGETIAAAAALLSGAEENAEPMDVVLISDNLANVDTLQNAVRPEAEVVVYDADAEPGAVIGQIRELADAKGRDIGSLTILSHGGSGYFHLGNETVTAESFEAEPAPDAAAGNLSEAWESLRSYMADNAQIHLMGCSVASQGGTGQTLLDNLADATGATVFASDDVTGGDGDWDLEAASKGNVAEADSPLEPDLLAAYDGNLTTSIPSAITTQEDEPGSFGIFIYGPDENAGSRVAGDVDLTDFGPNALLNNAQIFYEGFISDRPREIDGVMVEQYHRWTVDYDPVQNAFGSNGETSFRVEKNGVFEGNFTTDISILPVNDPPVAENGQFTTPEDEPVSGTLVGNDPVEGDSVIFEILEGPENGVITNLNSNTGAFVYTPNENYTGTDTFTFRTNDGQSQNNLSEPATVTIDITPVNDPPEGPTLNIDGPYIENGFVTPDQVDVPMELGITLGDDVDDTDYTRVVVEITDGYQNDLRGEDVLFLTGNLPSTIQANIATGENGVRQVVFTPADGEESAPISDFQLAVDQLRFEHVGGDDLLGPGEDANALNGDDPIERPRTIEVTVSDANASEAENGIEDSTGEAEFLVDAVNDGPEAEPTADTLTYSLNTSNSTRLALADNAFSIADIDDADLSTSPLDRGIAEIRVRIDEGYTAAVDTLEFDGTGFSDVDVDIQEGGRTLVLTPAAGDAFTLERAEAVVRQVAYVNAAENAAQANESVDREVSIVLTDNNSGGVGDFSQTQNPAPTQLQFLAGPKSTEVTRTIQIEADAPPTIEFGDGIFEDNGDPGDPFFSPRTEDQVEGFLVQDIVTAFNLPNQPPDEGVEALAVTAVDDANGQWQYLNSAGQWTPVDDGQLGEGHALLLGPTDQVRFIPNENFNTDETPNPDPTNNIMPSITAKSWDTAEFSGTAGTYVNTAGNNVGFSQEGQGALPVLAVNDAPDIGPGANLDPAVEQRLNDDSDGDGLNDQITFLGISLDDIDLARGEADEQDSGSPGEIRVTLTAGKTGSDIFLDNANPALLSGNGTDTVRLQGSLSAVQAALASGVRYQASANDLTNPEEGGFRDTLDIVADDLANAGKPDGQHLTDSLRINLVANSGPAIDLDPDDNDGGTPPAGPQLPDGPGSGPQDFSVFFIEDSRCTPVFIADAGDTSKPLIADREGDDVVSMEIRLTNPQPGDRLNVDLTGTNLTLQETVENGALVLRITGTAADTVYDQVLRTATFDTDSQNPDPTARIVQVFATDDQGATGNVANSRIAVVPVNDAPVNEVPTEIIVPSDEFENIGGRLAVGDVENPQSMSINVGVIFGVLRIDAANSGVDVDGNDTASLTITGSIDDVNAVLATLSYSPPQNFIGDDRLTITSNDFGNEGLNPSFISFDGVRCVIQDRDIVEGATEDVVDESGNLIPDPVNDNSPGDRDALTDVDTIVIRVVQSDPDALPEPPTPPPGPGLQPIVPPEADGPDGIGQGPVNLPGMVGLTEGRAGISARGIGPGGEGFMDFCSIEEALRSHLGCRFANTLNPESQFSSLSWGDMTDLGWIPPSLYLDEEYDLYSTLFLQEPGDPGFNVEAGAFGVDLGGLPETPERVFRQGQAQETFNEMEPNEIREAFFANRKNLDRSWR